jgi:hypothetical protein
MFDMKSMYKIAAFSAAVMLSLGAQAYRYVG